MSEVDVHVAGLTALAGACDQLAADLPGTVPPAPPTADFQPSAAAVVAVHADTHATGTGFAARLRDTGAQLSGAAERFSGTDDANAALIRSVTD